MSRMIKCEQCDTTSDLDTAKRDGWQLVVLADLSGDLCKGSIQYDFCGRCIKSLKSSIDTRCATGHDNA